MGMDYRESLALKFQLNMLSDWHVGSGYGRPGDVDALVARDDDNLPYVPAKTLTGILRDACEQVAFGLDDGQGVGAWSAWIDFIFGSQPAVDGHLQRPLSATLSVRSARFPESIRCQLGTESSDGEQVGHALGEVVTFTKPGVKLNALTGQSDDKCLRMEEMVRGGTILSADAQMNMTGLSPDQQHCALGLIAAGCQTADRIGGMRRRGGGRMSMRMILTEGSEKTEMAWLVAHSVNPPTPPENGISASSLTLAAAEEGTWFGYDMSLKLDSLIVAASSKKGNVVESLDYLPGTYLLPMISRALQQEGVDADAAIVNGKVLVSNATIDIGGIRGLPVPWALFREKLSAGDGKNAYNALQVVLERKKQYKGLRQGYVAWTKNDLAYKKVKMSVRMHNAIDDRHQRPEESGGGVYTYMAISGGQTFHACIRISQSVPLPEGWEQSLKGAEIRLGTSKKDDYGLAHIVDVVSSSEERHIERTGDQLVVWLTSDVLLRDNRLHPVVTPTALHDLLEQELGCKLAPWHPDGVADAPMNLVGHRRRTDSWQTSWGLPRPSLVGLCAGTCLIYRIVNVEDEGKFAEALRRLQIEGIGERRAEGYGQIQFDNVVLKTREFRLVDADSGTVDDQQPKYVKPEVDEEKYLQILHSAALTAEVRRAAATLAAHHDERQDALGISDRKPTGSQFGNLRAIASTVTKPNDPVVMAWLTHKGGVKDLVGDKWGESAKVKLTALFEKSETVWTLLSGQGGSQMKQLLKAGSNDSTWAEAVRTLLDQCIRFEKRDREKSQGGER